MSSFNKQFGAIFILIGTEVGAGVLALPLVVANFGFLYGCALLVIAWLIMMYTTFLICKLNLSLVSGSSFSSLAERYLGGFGTVIVWCSFLLILYPILIAYISAAGSILGEVFSINTNLAGVLFVTLLGAFVLCGTSKVDWLNRLLLSIKLGLLVYVCITLSEKVHVEYLLFRYSSVQLGGLVLGMPILMASFVGHIIVPTLRVYLDSDKKAIRNVLFIGGSIPLVLYFFWIYAIIGTIPPVGTNSLEYLISLGKHANVSDILHLLKLNLHDNKFVEPISIFSSVSVSTSFLSVSLSLKDFVIDGLKLNRFNKVVKYTAVVSIVFISPVIVNWLYANIFLYALNVVGIACVILLVIIPPIMMNSYYKQNDVLKKKIAIVLFNICITAIGVGLILGQVLSFFKLI